MLGIFCRRLKRGLFSVVFIFLKKHSGATQLKKGKKWRKKSRFGPSGKIPSLL
jgi:hypothetical protein